MDYAASRFYDAQQGRFTQVDPIGMSSTSLEDPQTLNLFAYCAGDPINRLDPTGFGFLSALKRFFKRIVNALIAAAVAFVFTFLVTGNIPVAFAAAGAAFMTTLLAAPKPGVGLRTTAPGTGGVGLRDQEIPPAERSRNSVAFNKVTWGILKLTLHPTSYDFEFIPVATKTSVAPFRDVSPAPVPCVP